MSKTLPKVGKVRTVQTFDLSNCKPSPSPHLVDIMPSSRHYPMVMIVVGGQGVWVNSAHMIKALTLAQIESGMED